MRWQVMGTEMGSGREVVVEVEGHEAAQAVHQAMERGIVVGKVKRLGLWAALKKRWGWPVIGGVAAVMMPICCGLYFFEKSMREELGRSEEARSRLEAALEHARSGVQVTPATRAAELEGQLAGAQAELTQTQCDLAAARTQMASLEQQMNGAARAANDLAAMKRDLAVAQARAAELELAARTQQERVTELESLKKQAAEAEAKAAMLAKDNAELARENETLKGQLLVAAKTAAIVEQPVKVEEPVAPVVANTGPAGVWAMRASYDAAADFVTLHFPKEGQTVVVNDDGTVTVKGLLAANAATIRWMHDKANQRVYWGELSIALAEDGPKEKLAENWELVKGYVRVFTASEKVPEAWLREAVHVLAGKSAGERMMRLGEEGKLTVWSEGTGVYVVRVEAAGGQ